MKFGSCVIWMTLAACSPGLSYGATDQVCRGRSQEILQALQSNNAAAVAHNFDSRVRAAVSADTLNDIWQHQLPLQFGVFQKEADPQSTTQNGAVIVDTPLHFAQGWLHMLVKCEADGSVSGLRFAPGPAPAGTPVADHHDDDVQNLAGVREQALAVPSSAGPLPGMLMIPAGKGPFPVVVMVAGSGAHDHDETIGPNKPFLDLARGLAVAGIASLRYDKRTFAYGSQLTGKLHGIDDEVTDDALSAIRLLATQPQIDSHRVFVLGHSLGAMMAPRIGQRDPQLAGLILLASPARSLLDVSAQQVREQGQRKGLSDAKIATDEDAIASEEKLLAEADPQHPPQGQFGAMSHAYLLSLWNYHQVDVAKNLTMPLLILQGGSDFQVSPTNDFAHWQTALKDRPNTSFHMYPGLSHLFSAAGPTLTVDDYQAPAHVDKRVIGDIADWVKAQPARSQNQ